MESRIMEALEFQQFTQILHGRWNRVDEMLLALKVPTETISTQHLQRTEKDKERQSVDKVTVRRHFDVLTQRLVILIDQFTTQFVADACQRNDATS